MMCNRLVVVAAVSLILEACSSRPREFTPTLGIAPTDQAKFDAAYADCQQLYVAGKLDSKESWPPAVREQQQVARWPSAVPPRRPAPVSTAGWR